MKNDLDDIIGRLRRDDREAFNLLYYMYAEKIYKFSLTFFNRQADAEEVVQEVFVKIWMNRSSIIDPSTFNAYIYTIAKNLIFNNLKKNIYRKKYESYYLIFGTIQEQTTENDVLYEEARKRLDNALEKLPEKRKEVFLLSRRDGLKNAEIADKLNVSIKTVETHMGLALKYLRDVFGVMRDT
jgi:RNA polymerase sigma-70 factor (ECF subfamily)